MKKSLAPMAAVTAALFLVVATSQAMADPARAIVLHVSGVMTPDRTAYISDPIQYQGDSACGKSTDFVAKAKVKYANLLENRFPDVFRNIVVHNNIQSNILGQNLTTKRQINDYLDDLEAAEKRQGSKVRWITFNHGC
ncbi:hypothetical protein [Variovorax terrae]|uniref:Secreted protein n=1 Tax=Variovorax terrae TaxID=2923278 RepID=A0A9X2AMW4_9BURK|nr:hypothetical protein [Variovorax terrae]MCJ0763190.1 hypothetical protein [Variovorax terrae]